MAISGGSGHFEVCAKMMQMTKQKIIDHGIGCDLICLSKPPLHMARPPPQSTHSPLWTVFVGGGACVRSAHTPHPRPRPHPHPHPQSPAPVATDDDGGDAAAAAAGAAVRVQASSQARLFRDWCWWRWWRWLSRRPRAVQGRGSLCWRGGQAGLQHPALDLHQLFQPARVLCAGCMGGTMPHAPTPVPLLHQWYAPPPPPPPGIACDLTGVRSGRACAHRHHSAG